MFCLHWSLFQGVIARLARYLRLLVLPGMIACPLMAADIKELRITEDEDVFSIKMIAVVDVPVKYVNLILTDYVHIYRLNPSIIESRILPAPDNALVRVKTRIVDCIFIFCMEVNRVEDILHSSENYLHAEIVPALSNFRSGNADWHMQDMGERCQVTYLAQMEPDFYIPPLIGSYFFKAKLYDDIKTGLTKLECLAKIREELDWNPSLKLAGLDIDTVCAKPCDSSVSQCPP